jgi:hypothetical protein
MVQVLLMVLHGTSFTYGASWYKFYLWCFMVQVLLMVLHGTSFVVSKV